MTAKPRLVLASGSPRRADLLRQIGVPFEVVHPHVDETRNAGESASDYVLRMAVSKARACAREGEITLAADTIVVVDDEIMGKPADRADGLRMLQRLSGRSHRVSTAIAVTDGENLDSTTVTTEVHFAGVDPRTARAYWDTGEAADKAGGYGIQGIGGIFAVNIEGSYSAVVGLPLAETERLLLRSGLDTWRCRLDG